MTVANVKFDTNTLYEDTTKQKRKRLQDAISYVNVMEVIKRK